MRKSVIHIGRLLGAMWAVCLLAACSSSVSNPVRVAQLPPIFPDYVEVTVPVGIAPLNFNLRGDDVEAVDVVVKGEKGGELHANGEMAQFDVDQWHRLTEANQGSDLIVTVCARYADEWRQFNDFRIHVSQYPLEEWGLTYRRIPPGYEVYSHMGLYQRDLASFDEYEIIDNRRMPGGCVNCHTANRTNPSTFVFHVRGEHGATMIQRDGQREWLKARNDLLGGSMVYPYWHPEGVYCAFSTNQTRQGFHVVPDERIEVFDLSSDIFVYNTATHEIITDSLVMMPDWSENCPVFAPDGRTMYFLTCRQQEYPSHFKDEKYALCRIGFDPEKGQFAQHVDTLFNAPRMGKSLTWPRPSYDGRFVLFTLIDYGYFSIWHEEADQWLLDLTTGEAKPLDAVNSPRADSYHNWSENSRWIVFTSRRDDGLYSRLYMASVDENGKATKPFLLPQKNPWQYYDETVYAFNTPDFTKEKVRFDAYKAIGEIMSDGRVETKVR